MAITVADLGERIVFLQFAWNLMAAVPNGIVRALTVTETCRDAQDDSCPACVAGTKREFMRTIRPRTRRTAPATSARRPSTGIRADAGD
jgi:hypothetical protein